jgi:flagellar basal-body rod protein FlgF
MSDAIYTAGTGAMVQQMRLELLSNNLANVNSPGYKADRALFRAYLPGGDESAAGAPNLHVQFDGSRIDFSDGPVKPTGNPLDLALAGSGFFSVETPGGVRYTRSGNFTRSADGLLTTQDGHPVLGDGGPIQLGRGAVSVDSQGNVSVDGAGAGRLSLVDFPEPDRLEKAGDGLLVPVEGADGEALAENVSVRQGFVEMANVNPILEMTEMVEVLRTYEAYQKMIRAISDADGKVINEVGRPV